MKPSIKAWALLRRLAPYLREQKADLVKAAIAVLFTTAAALANPLLLREIIDNAVPKADLGSLGLYAGAFVIVLIVGVFVGYAQTIWMARAGLRVVNRLKAELFGHLLRLDLGFFDEKQVGWLIARTESDTEQTKQLCSHVTIRLVSDALVFGGIAITLWISDPEIAAPMLGVVAVLLAAVFFFLGSIRKVFDDVRGRVAELTGFISEYVQGVPIIQLYNRQNDVRDELDRKAGKLYDQQVKASFLQYSFWALFALFTQVILIGIILWIGVAKLYAGTMSLGKLVMFVEFARQMTWPLHMFAETFGQMQRSLVATERVFTLMDEKPRLLAEVGLDESEPLRPIVAGPLEPAVGTPLNPEGSIAIEFRESAMPGMDDRSPSPLPSPSPLDPELLEFRNVSFSYKEDSWALDEVSFKIRRGEHVAIVGPSGGGKSTTANLLCRFYDPTRGAILADGRDLRDIHPAQWRRGIGLVLQDIYLFPGTVLDNLRALDLTIPSARVERAARELGAHAFIESFQDGYATELAERGANLSLGERQLLSFTRALTHDPRLLILDEATSAVDRHTESLLQQALLRLLQGRTAVVIAHRLSTIRNADRILVLDGGRVTEEGSHDDLMKNEGLYHRLYSLQAAHGREGVSS